MFLEPSQIRHPERSAARIYRITDGLCAKSKDPGDARWQMLFQAFRPRTTCQIKKVTSSERSAAQIYRVTNGLGRGVEEPVPSVAEGTPAMLAGRCSLELSGHGLHAKS